MSDFGQHDDDRIAALFREHVAPVADNGFSAGVVRRVRRHRLVRLLTITLATAAGLLLALAPANRLLTGLDTRLATLLGSLERDNVQGGTGDLLEALHVHDMLAALGRQITETLALPVDAAWLADNQPLAMAIVLALASAAVIRALAR